MNEEAPGNSIYIVLGEINLLLSNLRRNNTNNKYTSSHYDQPQDPLSRNFNELKLLLSEHADLSEIDASTFLTPFLEVIKSEETSGPVTGLALTSVNKFISYGLIPINNETTPTCVQQIAESITHARFVGTDSASDEVVLMKIINVLRTLMLSAVGFYLTNSCVCEIMQSCFQICFENRLSELLRRSAESILVDMVQLLFARLPSFKEEIKYSSLKKMTMKGDNVRHKKAKKATKLSTASNVSAESNEQKGAPVLASSSSTTLATTTTNENMDKSQTPSELESKDADSSAESSSKEEKKPDDEQETKNDSLPMSTETKSTNQTANECLPSEMDKSKDENDYVNPRGVRFIADGPNGVNIANIPYGLPCIRELLRFLITLINARNPDSMKAMGLNLITIAFESGVDHIAAYQSLLAYVKDDLCKNLYNLLSTERLSIYAATLRLSFLLFESMRSHLKLQMEHLFIKLIEIIQTDNPNKVPHEQKEMTIEYFLQLLRIPGFGVELFLNYDCCLNCSNIFEELTKLLSKNAFSAHTLMTANSLSLSALLAIIDNIEFDNNVKYNASMDRLSLLHQSMSSTRMPASSGYSSAKHLHSNTDEQHETSGNITTSGVHTKSRGTVANRSRENRMKINVDQLPTPDELKSTRMKKKLVTQSVDLFNTSPSKCIQFLKDNNIFSADTDLFTQQLIKYLKETPALDKKIIGEYLSNRKNTVILEKFVNSFGFGNLRIDEALRLFLETFRLPGEAPLISSIMEHFARHWRASNNNKFENDDAAFTLAYAIIMLNVDQHNHNVKKQSTPMSCEDFKKNLSKVNGGGNFDESMLEEIYTAIKNEEIVMPSEHTGVLRDNYLWKVLIRRGQTSDSHYTHAPMGSYNREIFNIVWGQTISAFSFVFDKSLELSVIQKTINGFRKCAQIAAHYSMSDVFDNIVISLCKFTNLANQSENVDQVAISFGMNNKAQLACKTAFQLIHNHGDILRDGWKNILDCIVQLYKAKLLPKVLVECEDYLDPKGRISLIKEETPVVQKAEVTGLFSSLFPFMSSDLSSSKGPTQEEQEAIKNAQSCVEDCHIEQLIHDTKFLRVDSLIELVKTLLLLSQINESDLHSTNTNTPMSNSNTMTQSLVASSNSNMSADLRVDMEAATFSLEILIKIVLQNRDRIACIWSYVRNHFYNSIVNAAQYSFFIERIVVGLLRIAARLLRKEDLSNEVLSSLQMLLLFKNKHMIRKLSRQVAFGIHDLLRTNAANIHSNDHWTNIFRILQIYGAGASSSLILSFSQMDLNATNQNEKPMFFTKSISIECEYGKTKSNENLNEPSLATQSSDKLTDRGYTSDSELYQQPSSPNFSKSSSPTLSEHQITKREMVELMIDPHSTMRSPTGLNVSSVNQYKIDLDDVGLSEHDKKAFAKCCETLTFLIRDMAHISLQNFESCIQCLRTFVEACVMADRRKSNQRDSNNKKNLGPQKSTSQKNLKQKNQSSSSSLDYGSTNSAYDAMSFGRVESDDDEQFVSSYETISIQLLDLLDTLHLKAASIFSAWAEGQQTNTNEKSEMIGSIVANLWSKCWCPILQGIARLGCDSNSEVRMHALQYLQRALLVQELQKLSATEWEACFNKVLFPLLAKLLENIEPTNSIRMEETRMRASTLLCKVFLQHLTTLARLSTFTALWLTILDYMDKYMKSDKSDLLHDVIPESLKNMLLVMDTTGLFNQNNSDVKFSQLCIITKDRIESFLPGLWEDLFKANRLADLSSTSTTTSPSSATIPVEKKTNEIPVDHQQQQQQQQQQVVRSLSESDQTNNLADESKSQSSQKLESMPSTEKLTAEIKDI